MILQADKNPWLGLASYEYNDAYRFFGREEELSELKTAICNNLFTTIYGISGAGKTSLINAGMMPLLEKEGYLPVRVRLDHKSKIGYNSQIVKAIVSTLDNFGGEVETDNVIDQEYIAENERLWNFLFSSKFWSKSNHQVTPVIFIDQFEEIFTNNDSEETIRDFFEVINSLQYNVPPTSTSSYLVKYEKYVDYNDVAQLRIVLIMREDFLARLEDYSFNIPALRKNRRGIKRMNGLRALEVIQKPMPDIVSRDVAINMLGKVTGKIIKDSPRDLAHTLVDTSILSLFCSELYQKAVSAQLSTFTEELVGQFGDNIISSFYEVTMGLVSVKTMEYLESHLLTYSGFRNSVALEDLEQNGIRKEELTRLTEKRLIRIESSDGLERVEFTHDVLCNIAKNHRDKRNENKSKRQQVKQNVIFAIESLYITFITLYMFWFKSMEGVANYFIKRFSDGLPLFLTSSIICWLTIHSLHSKSTKTSFYKQLISIISFISLCVIINNRMNGYPHIVKQFAFERLWDYKTELFFLSSTLLLLNIIMSFFKGLTSLRKATSVIYGMIVSIYLYHSFQNWVAVSLLFYSLFILASYRFSTEKNAWWITLCSLCVFIFTSIVIVNSSPSNTYNEPLVSTSFFVICISLTVSILLSLRYNKKRKCIEAWDYCLLGKIYKDNPFMKKFSLYLALFAVLFVSFIIGLPLDDKNSIVGTICLSCISAVLLFQLLFSEDVEIDFFKNKKLGTKEIFSCHKTINLFFLLFVALVGICVSQYMVLHLMWMLVIWLITAIIIVYSFRNIIKPINTQSYRNISKIFLLWIVAFVCVPVLCFGYNVFSLPNYARVFDGTLGYGRIMRFMTIKDDNGAVGVRDRNNIVIPIQYSSIKYYRMMDYCSNLPFPYSIIKPIYNSHPEAVFLVSDFQNRLFYWDCSEHLNLDNICTTMYVNYYSNALFYDYDLYGGDISKYMTYLKDTNDTLRLKETIEMTLVNSLKNRLSMYDSKSEVGNRDIQTFDDLKKYISKVQAADFAECIPSHLFPYANSVELSRLLIDTLWVKCINYHESCVNHSGIAEMRIYAKDFVKALENAQIAVSKDEVLSTVRLAEALYLSGRVDDAINLLYDKKRTRIQVEKSLYYPYSEDDFEDYYKYLGDQVWQNINEFVGLGIIQDTLSQDFLKLKQCLIEESKTPDYDYAESMDHFRYADIRTYWDGKNLEIFTKTRKKYGDVPYKFIVQNGKIVSPIFNSFSLPIDNTYSVIIDAKDSKRKFLDFSEYTPKLIRGSYEHAWRFSEGMAAVSVNNKIGFINENGSFVIQPQYPYPQCDYWITYSGYDGNQIRIDKYNNIQMDFIYEQGQCRMSGSANKFGIIDKQGNWIIQPIYDKIGELLCGHRLVKIGDKYGLIDIKGNVVIPVIYNFKDISCKGKGWTVNSIQQNKVWADESENNSKRKE